MFERIRNKSHIKFYMLLAVLLLLLILRYAFMIEIPRLVLTGIIALIAIFGDKNEIMAIAMCCIPMHEAVDFYYAIVICAGVYVFKYPSRIRIGYSSILLFAMIIWELLHCFTPDSTIRLIIVAVAPLIFLAIVMWMDVSDIDYVFVVRSMAITAISVSFMCLMNIIVQSDYDIAMAAVNLWRLGVLSEEDTLLGGSINPNTMGVINVLISSSLLQINTSRNSNKINILFVVFLIGFGALTVSRTFLFCLILMAFLLIWGYSGDVLNKIRFIAVIAVLGIIVFFLISWLFPDLMEYYIGRFQVDDITTSRDVLFIKYLNYIFENVKIMFFGIGTYDFSNRIVSTYKVASNCPHNSIQEILIAWGIPGLIMIITLIATMIMQSKKFGRRKQLINYIPLIIILFKSMAGQLLTSGYSMLALAFAYLSLCQNFGQTNSIKQDNNEDFTLMQ